MEMHQLRYVAAVAQTGNFSRAAEQCNVSQPSLSQQIQKLEDELGERLFERMKRGTRLTPAGEAFLRHALRILEEAESARREAQDGGARPRGLTAIGVLPTVAPYLLPATLPVFLRKFPEVEVTVQEQTTSHLIQLAARREIDFLIASLPLRDDRLEIRELCREELLLALPPRHPLNRKKTLAARDLSGQPLILLLEGHCLGDQVLNFCDRHDARPAIRFRSSQLETIQALVYSGMGLSLTPAMAVRSGRHAPCYRSFAEPRPSRAIVAAWFRQRPLSRAAAEFLAVVEAHFKKTRNAARG